MKQVKILTWTLALCEKGKLKMKTVEGFRGVEIKIGISRELEVKAIKKRKKIKERRSNCKVWNRDGEVELNVGRVLLLQSMGRRCWWGGWVGGVRWVQERVKRACMFIWVGIVVDLQFEA